MTGAPARSHGRLRCREPRPGARAQLVCFPHAGGSAGGYLRWSSGLPDDVEVHAAQYPGREDRFDEPPRSHMSELVDPLVEALCPRPGARLVLFGHSLGGTICYEVAAGLQARGCPPDLAVISGQKPPSLHRPGDLHRRSDQALLADLRRLNPRNADAFDQLELMSLLLPMIRADYRAIETYHPRARPPLSCPLLIMVGESDPELSAADAEAWSDYTSAHIEVKRFAGDHFYLEPNREAVLTHLGRALARIPSAGRSRTHDSF